jgi:hypothetical protein
VITKTDRSVCFTAKYFFHYCHLSVLLKVTASAIHLSLSFFANGV